MAFLTAPFNGGEYGDEKFLNYPVEANTSIYLGAIVALDASGYAVPASAVAAQKIVGRAERVYMGTPGQNALNVSPYTSGAAGALTLVVKRGIFAWANGTGADAVGIANVGFMAYALDDHTVSPLDGTVATVTAEAITFDASTTPQIMSLGHSNIQRGSVVVTNSGASVTYVEGTDYAVEYSSGLLIALSGGAITAAEAVKATFKWSTASRSVVGKIVAIDIGGMIYVDVRYQSPLAL